VDILRTPDDRFENLPGFGFAPHYLEIPAHQAHGNGNGSDPNQTLRVHYLDEGAGDAAETVLLMHGEPSWCYLYRKMIPVLTEAGFRVIAPDLVGFGRSDKPANRTDYTYQRHVDWMRSALIEGLKLDQVTLLGQDWGGLIGLRLVTSDPDRFRRVVAANTGLPTGDSKPTEAFLAWQRFSQDVPVMPIGKIVGGGTTSDLPAEVVAAYDAPFPDETYKEGARQFPLLVPTLPDDPSSAANRDAWTVLQSFDRPFLCAYSDKDPITRGADRMFRELVPGCRDREHVTIEGGGHFLQEDRGEELAGVVVDFIRSTADG
jgi:haloalkane dehalogenase